MDTTAMNKGQYRLARQSAGLSLTHAAHLLKLTRGHLHQIERGDIEASDDQRAAMSSAYDVSVGFLTTGIPGNQLGDHLAKWHDGPDWMQHNILIEWSKRQA